MIKRKIKFERGLEKPCKTVVKNNEEVKNLEDFFIKSNC